MPRGIYNRSHLTKENHNHLKGGKPKCLDCKKVIHYYKIRCRSCYYKFIKVNSPNKGMKRSNKSKEKMRKAKLKKPVRYWLDKQRPTLSGERNPIWKGSGVGYGCLHKWVRYHKGKPEQCEHCGKIKTTPKSMHWANIDHKYRRKLSDFISLCAPCHKKYDLKHSLTPRNYI